MMTAWSRVLLDKLIVPQLVTKFPCSFWNPTALHLSLSVARSLSPRLTVLSLEDLYHPPTYFHVFPCCVLPSGFHYQTLCVLVSFFPSRTCHMPRPSHPFCFDHRNDILRGTLLTLCRHLQSLCYVPLPYVYDKPVSEMEELSYSLWCG